MSQHAANERRARYDALLMRRLALAAAMNALHAAQNTWDIPTDGHPRIQELLSRCIDEQACTEEAIDRINTLRERLDG